MDIYLFTIYIFIFFISKNSLGHTFGPPNDRGELNNNARIVMVRIPSISTAPPGVYYIVVDGGRFTSRSV